MSTFSYYVPLKGSSTDGWDKNWWKTAKITAPDGTTLSGFATWDEALDSQTAGMGHSAQLVTYTYTAPASGAGSDEDSEGDDESGDPTPANERRVNPDTIDIAPKKAAPDDTTSPQTPGVDPSTGLPNIDLSPGGDLDKDGILNKYDKFFGPGANPPQDPPPGGGSGGGSAPLPPPINFKPNNVTSTPEETAAAHLASGGTQAELDQVAAIYNSGDPVMIDNWEKFSSTGKYAPGTAWRATYDEAIANGNTHEDSRAWSDGVHKDNTNAANLPVAPVAVGAGIPVVLSSPAEASTAVGLTPDQYNSIQAIFKQYTGSEADADDINIHGPLIRDGAKSLDQLKSEVAGSGEASSYRTNIINQTFTEIVGRAPTEEDMSIWQQRLAGGESVESFRELARINAPNDQAAQAGLASGAPVMAVPDAPAPPSVSPNRDAINNIFRQYVGRHATADDLRIHEPRIDGGGVNLDQLKNEVANSAEAGLFRENNVRASFLQYVGRPADNDDMRIWTENLRNGSFDMTSFNNALVGAGESQNFRASMNITDNQGVTKDIYDLPVNDRNAVFNHIQNGGTFEQISNLGIKVGYGGPSPDPSSYPGGGGYMPSDSNGSSPVPPLPAANTNPNSGFSPFA